MTLKCAGGQVPEVHREVYHKRLFQFSKCIADWQNTTVYGFGGNLRTTALAVQVSHVLKVKIVLRVFVNSDVVFMFVTLMHHEVILMIYISVFSACKLTERIESVVHRVKPHNRVSTFDAMEIIPSIS